MSKRRSQSPRQRKEQGRNSTSPPQEASASVAPPADTSIRAINISEAPPPASELDELDAGWDELLV